MKKVLLFLLCAVSFSFSFSFPSHAQLIDDGFLIFQHTTLINQGKKYPITGIWSPKAIDQYDIMCIFHYRYYSTENYFMICSESQSNSWTTSLTGMKELFLKNDQIAKENGVTSKIEKNVSDKFTFSGFYGEGPARYANRGPLVKEYSGRGYAYTIYVIYKFENGQSSMELHLGDFYLGKSSLVWTFSCAEDFDNIIRALNWSDFMMAFNNQVKQYQNQQNAAKAAAEKQKNESALFD